MGKLTREYFVALDEEDPLQEFRKDFVLPEGLIYLDGNSLGALPRATIDRISRVVKEEWGQGMIRAWFPDGDYGHNWLDLPMAVGSRLAGLIGADPGEVIVTDTTSVNLFKLFATALRLRPDRRVILSEEDNFPTDNYMAQGLVDLMNQGRPQEDAYELRAVKTRHLLSAIDENVAVVSLTHVNYKTAAVHNMETLTKGVHAQGALILWDLSHSVGAVPLNLTACQVDFAVGCGYKYLNGGPGAPAFLYVSARHQETANQPLWGWLGHANPFRFERDYQPALGIRRFICSAPPILGLSALDEAVKLIERAKITQLRDKSMEMTELFLRLITQECGEDCFEVHSPRDPTKRGSQVSLYHPQGKQISDALAKREVIVDYRDPLIRIGFAPLYLRYVDIWDVVHIICQVMETQCWNSGLPDKPGFKAQF